MKKNHGTQIRQVCSKSFITVDDLLVNMEEAHKDTNLQSSSHFEHDNEDGANDQTNETKPVKKVVAKKFKCPFCVSEFSQKHNLKTNIFPLLHFSVCGYVILCSSFENCGYPILG